MVRYSKDSFVDIDKYEDRIRGGSYILIDKSILEQFQRDVVCRSHTLSFMYLDCMAQRSANNYIYDNKDSIIRYLMKYEYCPERYFETRKSQNLSLDMKRVCEPLYQNGYAQEFLDYYMQYRHLKSRGDNLGKLLASCGNEVVKGATGDLIKLHYNVGRQTNRRFNYNNFDIIAQIPKEVSHCIGVEDGYALVWGDFAQSDFRIAYNLFIRSDENDEIMDQYEDKYEAMARIVNKTLGTPFDPEKFKAERKQYKTQLLGTIYGKRHSVIKEENMFIQRFAKFLDSCPRYVEFKKRLEDSHDLGIPVVLHSYFGSEESSPVAYRKEDTVNRALNAPIQCGTSEMIILTVNDILDRFYARGWTEDDIQLYMVRHDEPVFKIRPQVLEDSWIFEDYRQILVDNWSPLQITFDVGYQYGVRNDELYSLFEQNAIENKDKLGHFAKEAFTASEYYPVEKIAHMNVFYNKVEDKAVVTILDTENDKATNFVVYSSNDDEIFYAIRKKFADADFQIKYRGILIQNATEDFEDYQNGMYLRYLKRNGPQLYNVAKLCNYATCVFCKSQGINSPVEPPPAGFKNYLGKVSKLEGFS